MPQIKLSISLANGIAPESFVIQKFEAGDTEGRAFEAEGGQCILEVEVLPLLYLHIVPKDFGYWSHYEYGADEYLSIQLKQLPQDGPIGWWHRLHGIDRQESCRGEGIRIGIIDEALSVQSENSCIANIHNLGLVGATASPNNRPYKPFEEHGEAVTSIIGSNCSDKLGYQGVAPGAEIYFASAGSDTSERLTTDRVANAIEYLAHECQCDFINISAGDYERPIPAIHNSVIDAWDVGTLCFFASGNRKTETTEADVLYPARYAEALSVAACGKRGFAPLGTEESLHDIRSKLGIGEDYYQWWASSDGGGVDFMAAGSNVIWTSEGSSARAVNGTSFASPIATGVAAVVCSNSPVYRNLPRTAERSEQALELIRHKCTPLDKGQSDVQYGLIHV